MHVRMADTIRDPLMKLQAELRRTRYRRMSIGEVAEEAIKATLHALTEPKPVDPASIVNKIPQDPPIAVHKLPAKRSLRLAQRALLVTKRSVRKAKSGHSLIPKKQTSRSRAAAGKGRHVRS